MTNIEAGTRKVKKEEKAALEAAGCITVEPLVATTSRKQPVLLSNLFSQITKVSKSNTTFGSS